MHDNKKTTTHVVGSILAVHVHNVIIFLLKSQDKNINPRISVAFTRLFHRHKPTDIVCRAAKPMRHFH